MKKWDKTMIKQTKFLISVFVILIALAGGFYIYNKLLVSEKPVVSEEKPLSSMTISIPSELEVIAYKKSSFNFSIKNEREDLKNVSIVLEGVLGEITPNNISVAPNVSQTFEVNLDELEPGNYNLYIKIQEEPNIDITKTISLKSQIVVGLDGYHDISPGFPKNYWEWEESDDWYFVEFLHKNNIKTKVIKSSFSPEVLEGINVVIIKSPKQSFLSRERETLKSFLDQGGGLLLVCSVAMPQVRPFTEDLFVWLNLQVKLGKDLAYSQRFGDITFVQETDKGWTEEITEHSITSGIREIWHHRSYVLDIEKPMISLVKKDGKTIYAIQHYSRGKIGIIAAPDDLITVNPDRFTISSSNRNQLNLNLIHWLAKPEDYEEMG